jgi:hypothetical protein
MNRNYQLILLSLIYFSCSTKPNKALNKETLLMNDSIQKQKGNDSVVIDEETGIVKPQIVTDSNKMQIISLTDTLYKGDTLRINFKVPHYKDLGIITPSENFFFVVYAYTEKDEPSLVDWNEFENQRNIEIITDKTKANPWNAQIKENKIIFRETGVYKIQLSENLETDDGTPIEVRSVYYINRKRKS